MSHQEIITQIGIYSVLLRNINQQSTLSQIDATPKVLEAAYESGLSSSHLIQQQKIAHDALLEGRAYYQKNELEASLNQAIIALQRMPNDLPTLGFACDCYARLYLKYKREELLFATTQLAEIILLFDPRNPQAIHLRTEFVDQQQRIQQRKHMNILLFVGLSILFVYTLWATLIYDPTLTEEEMQQMRREVSKEVDFPPNNSQPEEILGIPSLQIDPKFGEFHSKIDFEIQSPDLEGLHVQDAGSYLEFQPDNNKINLYFKGYLQNNTNVELRSVEAILKLLHDDILIHKIKFSMLPLYKGPIRPNDSVATDAILSKAIEPVLYKHPNRIVIEFTDPSIQPPPTEYPESEVVDVFWEVNDQNSEITAKSRFYKVTKEMISKYWTVDQFEIYNTGQTLVHTLKIEVRYFDGTDKLILADSKYVVTSNGALFIPNQFLLLDFRNDLKKRPRRKELIITELETLDTTKNTLQSIQILTQQANIPGINSMPQNNTEKETQVTGIQKEISEEDNSEEKTPKEATNTSPKKEE